MGFANRHLDTATKIITGYDGTVPLHHYLKQFFAGDKKYGSKDRKAISHACYCFYRLGHSLKNLPPLERVKTGIFLCTPEPGNWKEVFDERWLNAWSTDQGDRMLFSKKETGFDASEIFPFNNSLSEGVDARSLALSHLIQPDLHIRVRPGKDEKVREQLSVAGVPFTDCGETCLTLPNATKIEKLLDLNVDVVIQDRSSQRVAGLLSKLRRPGTVSTWDCCAASGGKSILAADVLGSVDLVVSDVRPSIINNLRSRFAAAGIQHFRSFIADVADGNPVKEKFDLVICDAPCTGSGTWSRNPEQLYFFRDEKTGHYASLQQRIAGNAIQAVKNDGYFLYITCSVFSRENEEAVQYILGHSSLKLVQQELLKGYNEKADTLFAALFTASPL